MQNINIDVLDAFNFLSKNLNSHLIDTRSDLEWKMTGIPDLSSINKETNLINWGPVVDKNFFENYQNFFLIHLTKKIVYFLYADQVQDHLWQHN